MPISTRTVDYRIYLGMLFAALTLILILAIILSSKNMGGSSNSAVASLRRSVKAHEQGIYSGYYLR